MNSFKFYISILGLTTALLLSGCQGTFSTNSIDTNLPEDILNITPAGAPTPLPINFGTSHAAARYNPYGPVQTSFVDGAVDAYNLGFQNLKIWVGPEITQESFYYLSAKDRESYKNFSSTLNMTPFKKVFALPFKTLILVADTHAYWQMTNNVLSKSQES
ncbi:MAG: hypothetical protein KDD38_08670, partial [Bdellovibrionales bacterium]|nr:hypothetical protein [Bdellovibrionales bacterium]